MIIAGLLYVAFVFVLVFLVCLMMAGSPRLPDERLTPPIDTREDDDFFAGPYGIQDTGRSAPEHAPDRAPTRGGESDGSGAGRPISSSAHLVIVPDSVDASDADVLMGYLMVALTRDGAAQLQRERERTA